MATEQTGEIDAMENSIRTSHPGFSNDKYSLLVIVGEHSRPGLVDYVVAEIERGIRSWDIDLTACNLDEQLKLFVSRHSAFFSEEVKVSTHADKRGSVLPIWKNIRRPQIWRTQRRGEEGAGWSEGDWN